MDWIQLTVLTTTEGSEIISEQLIEAGSGGTVIEDRNDIASNQRPAGQWDIIDENIALTMSEDVRVTGYYVADARAQDIIHDIHTRIAALKSLGLDIDLGKLTVEIGNVDDEDWAEYWKKQYVPFRLGKHMVVKPSWTEYETSPGDKIIELDPGMAFGTGTHETSGLCVELVEEYVKPGDSVIDIGTGTGILAMAAALCGAKDVLATDIDPMAVRVAAENVRINGMEGVVRTREGDLLEAVDEVADVVTANIIAAVIAALAAPVRAHIKDGGLFICSGIARECRDEVIEALVKAGYTGLDIRDKGEWTAIACKK